MDANSPHDDNLAELEEQRKAFEEKRKRKFKNTTLKVCSGPCQGCKPEDEFDRDDSKPDGLRTWCRQCRKERRDAVEDEAEGDAIRKMILSMDHTVLARLSEVNSDGGTNLPHQVQALECILQRLGGVEGFATYYVAQLIGSPVGGGIREKMLSKIWSAIQSCSDDGKVEKPRDAMSDEELLAITSARMKRMGLNQHVNDN
jgi:hypothetical protein